MREFAQILFATGTGMCLGSWLAGKLLSLVPRDEPVRRPNFAEQRFIERDWAEEGVYDPDRSTDWEALERRLEQTLRARKS